MTHNIDFCGGQSLILNSCGAQKCKFDNLLGSLDRCPIVILMRESLPIIFFHENLCEKHGVCDSTYSRRRARGGLIGVGPTGTAFCHNSVNFGDRVSGDAQALIETHFRALTHPSWPAAATSPLPRIAGSPL